MRKSDGEPIERWFREGMREGEDLAAMPDWCPYVRDSQAAHWWTRGFAYQARNLRAIQAERLNAELLDALKRAVRTIRTWHGMGLGTMEAQAWALYQASPEMTQINTAIAKAEGR